MVFLVSGSIHTALNLSNARMRNDSHSGITEGFDLTGARAAA